jgi:hypothetical protein
MIMIERFASVPGTALSALVPWTRRLGQAAVLALMVGTPLAGAAAQARRPMCAKTSR